MPPETKDDDDLFINPEMGGECLTEGCNAVNRSTYARFFFLVNAGRAAGEGWVAACERWGLLKASISHYQKHPLASLDLAFL